MHTTLRLTLMAMVCLFARAGFSAPPVVVSFELKPGDIQILADGQPLATYVFQDEKISRPYFAHVRAPGGIPVTRNHPPVSGKDRMDHADLHPGIWLAFGQLSGSDNWGLKAKVRHDAFLDEPRGGPNRGSFTVRNSYLSADGTETICQEKCRYAFLVRPSGYLILADSEFRSDNREFVFGDQEEMGLGIRVATPIAVAQGGQITLSTGQKNEAEAAGKSADWCDYSGIVDEHRAGITLMPSPKNFRPSWFHARDYGLIVANPFARETLGQDERSEVTIKPGESFALGFGILVHASPKDSPVDIKAAYADYLEQAAKDSE